MNTSLRITLIAFVLLAGCGVPTDGSGVDTPTESQGLALTDPLEALEKLPPWCAGFVYGPEELKLLREIGKELMAWELDDIRAALVDARDKLQFDHDYLNASKIYVVMRILFEIPKAILFEKRNRVASSSSSFLRPNCFKGDCSLYWSAWPVKWDMGDIEVVYPCEGAKVNGPNAVYRFVQEFDAMRATWPRRKW